MGWIWTFDILDRSILKFEFASKTPKFSDPSKCVQRIFDTISNSLFVSCPVCGSELTDGDCSSCIKALNKCVLCFLEFEDGDTLLQCIECRYFGHSKNFEIWLKRKGKCPVCLISYTASGFKSYTLSPQLVRDTYQISSQVKLRRQAIFDSFRFRLDFYDFQTLVIEKILNSLNSEDNFLLVSPPGSGKTIVGLALAGELSVHTLILTPNLAVLGSWMDRVSMFLETKDDDLEVNDIINIEEGELRPFTITTYHKIHSEMKKNHWNHQESNGEKTLIDHFKSHNVQLIILDEAHRLTGEWGKTILDLLREFPGVKVLGLTATPPQEKSATFEDLFPKISFEIPLPLLVRKGILAPYNDLVMTYPTFEELQTKIVDHFGEQIELQSDEYVDLARNSIDELLKKISNQAKKHFSPIKNSYELNLLKSYYEYFLIDILGKASFDLNDDAEWLYENNSYKSVLTMEIIKHEMELLKEKTRILVLLDQENHPTKYSLPFTGVNGAIGIFEQFVKEPEVDLLQPILVTGKSLLVDDDFTREFVNSGKEWAKKRGLQIKFKVKSLRKKKYSIVTGSGRHWNTETYTRYVTHLFDEGLTRLLVGTRFLLGEGWDSLTLNTLIDLTTIRAYTTVNQVKGRAFRMDPANPDKISNIWEIIPNTIYHGQYVYGRHLLANFMGKHSNYFGMDSDGNIRSNISRLNSKLKYKSPKSESDDDYFPYLTTPYDVLNEESIKKSLMRIEDSDKFREKWQVGKDLGDLYLAIPLSLSNEFVSWEEKFVEGYFSNTVIRIIQKIFSCYNIEVLVKSQNEFRYLFILPTTQNNHQLDEIIAVLNDQAFETAIILDVDFQRFSDETYDFSENMWKLENQSRKMSYIFPIANDQLNNFGQIEQIHPFLSIRKVQSFKEITNSEKMVIDHIGGFSVEGVYLTPQELNSLKENKDKLSNINEFENRIKQVFEGIEKRIELEFRINSSSLLHHKREFIGNYEEFLHQYFLYSTLNHNGILNSKWKASYIDSDIIRVDVPYSKGDGKGSITNFILEFFGGDTLVEIRRQKYTFTFRMKKLFWQLLGSHYPDLTFQMHLPIHLDQELLVDSFFIGNCTPDKEIPEFKLLNLRLNKEILRKFIKYRIEEII